MQKRIFIFSDVYVLITLSWSFVLSSLVLCSWNEWLRLPVKYPDLPQSAQVALTVWDIYGPGKAVPVGGTTVTLFGKYG